MNIASLLYQLLTLYVLVIFARLILDYVRMFSRNWRPRGIGMTIANAVYALTDPPINAIRRVVPPVRIGAVSLDLSFIVIFFIIQIALRLIAHL